MKFWSYFCNKCAWLYINFTINYRNYIYYIFYICIALILNIVYVFYIGDYDYCISHEIEKNIIGDSSGSVQTKQSLEFHRHKEDIGDSTIRLVCQTPALEDVSNNPLCGSASTVSEDWSTRAVVGINGDNLSERLSGYSNSENTRVRGNCSISDQDNLRSLGARIDETIRDINGINSTRSTLLGEIPSGENNTVDDASRAEAIHSMRWALTLERDTSRLTPNDLERLGLLLQQLGEAERDLSANAPDIVNTDSSWSLETNNSNIINWEQRREIIRQQVNNHIESENSKVVSTEYNKIDKIKSDIDILKCKIESLYSKYYNAGKRRLFWNIWEKYRGNFDTYKEFKEYSGAEMKIRTELKRFWEEHGNPLAPPSAKNNDIYRRR